MPIILPSSGSSGGMTLSQLRSEVRARGADYLTDERIAYFLNRAQQEICEAFPWPFLETEITGTAPLAITDLKAVLSVHSATHQWALDYLDRRTVLQYSGDLTTAGVPTHWYFENDTISVYPVSTDDITVRYVMTVSDMASDGDETIIPSRWSDLLVDGAMIRVHKDDDHYDGIAVLRQEWDRQLAAMKEAYSSRNLAGPDFIVQREIHDW